MLLMNIFQLLKKLHIIKSYKLNYNENNYHNNNLNNHNFKNHNNNRTNKNENKQKKHSIHLVVEANINGKANAESNEINRNDDKRAKNIANSFFYYIMCIIVCII